MLDEGGKPTIGKNMIRGVDWTFIGFYKLVQVYYHDWFQVKQLGFEQEFKKWDIEPLKSELLEKIGFSEDRKKNAVCEKINLMRTEFYLIDNSDVFSVSPICFGKMLDYDLPLDLLDEISRMCSCFGWFKISFFK
jgi:hypothetical protein